MLKRTWARGAGCLPAGHPGVQGVSPPLPRTTETRRAKEASEGTWGGAVRPDRAGPVGGSVVPQPSVVVEHVSFVPCASAYTFTKWDDNG